MTKEYEEWLSQCAKKSLFYVLMYFFARNPRYKLRENELPAILRLVADQFIQSMNNRKRKKRPSPEELHIIQ